MSPGDGLDAVDGVAAWRKAAWPGLAVKPQGPNAH